MNNTTIEFDWDEGNINHLALHQIESSEAEQVITNWQIDLNSYIRNGEERVVQAGETNHGRILVVVSTIRNGKIRVVTAWPAKEKVRQYFKSQKEKRDA